MKCNCCKQSFRRLYDDTCYLCTVKYLYRVAAGNSIPYWIENLDPLVKDEDSVVVIEGVDLRCVRASIRELLTKMWPTHTIVLLNFTRTMLGIIHLPHCGDLRGITFYATRHIDKISPELAMSIGVSEVKEATS